MDAKPKLIRQAHQRGHRVHVYTVNQRQDMLRLFKRGVDEIFTDDPPLALDVLKQIGKWASFPFNGSNRLPTGLPRISTTHRSVMIPSWMYTSNGKITR